GTSRAALACTPSCASEKRGVALRSGKRSAVPVLSTWPASEPSIWIRAPRNPSGTSPALASTTKSFASLSMITTDRASTSERPRFAISSRTRSSSSSPPTASAISLAACPLELLATALGSCVEACILDRDRRPFGQYHGGLFVALVEFAAALVCEVQVPVGLPADEDRHAQERR